MQRHLLRGQVPGIGTLHQGHTFVIAQLPVKLTIAYVNGINMLGTIAEQHIRKPTGGGANVHAHFSLHICMKRCNGLFQLQTAPACIRVRRSTKNQLVLRLHRFRGLQYLSFADIHLSCHDAGLRLFTAFAQSPCYQRHIGALLITHASVSLPM